MTNLPIILIKKMNKRQVVFMKLFLKAACAAFVLTVLYSMIPFQAACADISGEVFRLHIIANSDTEADQALKLRVRDAVLACSQPLFERAQSKEEAEALTAAHLEDFARAAAREIQRSGCTYSVRAELTRMYFPTGTYERYTLPSGTYDALRLTIGEGKGHNWWCVMFPSLCINTEKQGDGKTKKALGENGYHIVRDEQQEYKFFIVELFEALTSEFHG